MTTIANTAPERPRSRKPIDWWRWSGRFFLVFMIIYTVVPMAWMLITSLKTGFAAMMYPPQWWPAEPTLDNYFRLLDPRDSIGQDFLRYFGNSIFVSVTTTILAVAVAVPAAYAFSRFSFPGRSQLMLGYLLVRMFTAVLMIIPLFVVMRQLGLLDSTLGLAIAYTSFLLPLFVWMLKGFFDAAPRELESAARVDGSTRIGAMFRIVVPIARNGLVATCVFVAIAAWNEYLFALMLTTSQGSRTWPVGLQLMSGEFQLPWGMLAAGGIISIIPVIVLFAIVQRVMVAGITAGAVKG